LKKDIYNNQKQGYFCAVNQYYIMKTQIIHVDHRKVQVEIRDAPKGRKLIIAIRDMGASEMWEQKPNPLGAYIRKQWNKTYIYKKCAAWAALTASQIALLDEITA